MQQQMARGLGAAGVVAMAVALCVSLSPWGGVLPLAEASHIGCGAVLGPGGVFILDSNVGPCGATAITVIGRPPCS